MLLPIITIFLFVGLFYEKGKRILSELHAGFLKFIIFILLIIIIVMIIV